MDSRKTLAIALALMASPYVRAEAHNDPVEKATFYTFAVPSILVAGTLVGTTMLPQLLMSSKDDAVAFIGSNGEIRGAQFEQALRYYHANNPPPYLTDEQFALAIVTAFRE